MASNINQLSDEIDKKIRNKMIQEITKLIANSILVDPLSPKRKSAGETSRKTDAELLRKLLDKKYSVGLVYESDIKRIDAAEIGRKDRITSLSKRIDDIGTNAVLGSRFALYKVTAQGLEYKNRVNKDASSRFRDELESSGYIDYLEEIFAAQGTLKGVQYVLITSRFKGQRKFNRALQVSQAEGVEGAVVNVGHLDSVASQLGILRAFKAELESKGTSKSNPPTARQIATHIVESIFSLKNPPSVLVQKRQSIEKRVQSKSTTVSLKAIKSEDIKTAVGSILLQTLEDKKDNLQKSATEKKLLDQIVAVVQKYLAVTPGGTAAEALQQQYERELDALIFATGSDSYAEFFEKSIGDALQGTVKKPKQAKNYSRDISQPLSKNNKKPKKLKIPKNNTLRIRKGARIGGKAAGGRYTSSAQLLSFIQADLSAMIKTNMERPNLRNRTGRFAESVQANTLTFTNPTTAIIGYSYMYNPYATFEEGGRLGEYGYYPRRLIDATLRESLSRYISTKVNIRTVRQ